MTHATVEHFVESTLAANLQPTTAPEEVLFEAVRALPYATNTTHAAADLLDAHTGNCHAKADLLAQSLNSIGTPAKLVRYRYVLPHIGPQPTGLPTRFDIHTIVELSTAQGPLQLDPSHDPPLASLGLVVATFGPRPGSLCHEPHSPLWTVGIDDTAVASALADLARGWDALADRAAAQYQQRFNAWLAAARPTNQRISSADPGQISPDPERSSP